MLGLQQQLITQIARCKNKAHLVFHVLFEYFAPDIHFCKGHRDLLQGSKFHMICDNSIHFIRMAWLRDIHGSQITAAFQLLLNILVRDDKLYRFLINIP